MALFIIWIEQNFLAFLLTPILEETVWHGKNLNSL